MESVVVRTQLVKFASEDLCEECPLYGGSVSQS